MAAKPRKKSRNFLVCESGRESSIWATACSGIFSNIVGGRTRERALAVIASEEALQLRLVGY